MSDFSFFLNLPQNAKINVKEGREIKEKEKVAIFYPFAKKKIPLAQKLSCHPQDITKFIQVNLGDKVQENDILAQRSSLFKKIIIKSPFRGQVYAFDQQEGQLIIKIPQKKRDLLSPVAGEVTKIKKEGITIGISQGEIIKLRHGRGNIVIGPLAFHNKKTLTLDSQSKRKILLSQQISSSLLAKAEVLEIKAIITPAAIEHYSSSLTLGEVDKDNWEKLEKSASQSAIVDPYQEKMIILE